MLLLIFAASVLCVVLGRPAEPLEGPLWSPQLPPFSYENYPSRDSYTGDEDYEVVVAPPLDESKRGLTMFARWGQFNNIGKQRTPIRSNFEPFDSKSTRGRISGQPLRWG